MGAKLRFEGSFTVTLDGDDDHPGLAAFLKTLLGGASATALSADEGDEEGEGVAGYKGFWTSAFSQPRLRELYPNNQPTDRHYITTAALPRGAMWVLTFTRDRQARAEYYIDLQRSEDCKVVFTMLHGLQDRIEADFGGPLTWERLDTRKASRISVRIEIPDWRDDANWQLIIDRMASAMGRLRKALGPRLSAAHLEIIQKALDGGRVEGAIEEIRLVDMNTIPEVR
ncbi:DUF4268 domain-containing protein [Azospirillum argentinense]